MKAATKSLLLVGVIAFGTGCANRHTVMVNEKTKTTTACSASGWGYIGAPLAAASHNRCVKSFERAGYVEAGVAQGGPEGVDYSFPAHPDGEDWTVRRAKYALKRDGLINRAQYDRIIKDIRGVYDVKVYTYKIEYKNGKITKGRYEQKVREALYDYKG